jgi:C-terminal processing protease CtpA/Prc
LNPRLAGSHLSNIPEDLPLYGSVAGVWLIQVEPGSNAVLAGLLPGAVILSVDQRAVGSIADLQAVVGRRASRLLLNIQRGNAGYFIPCSNAHGCALPTSHWREKGDLIAVTNRMLKIGVLHIYRDQYVIRWRSGIAGDFYPAVLNSRDLVSR